MKKPQLFGSPDSEEYQKAAKALKKESIDFTPVNDETPADPTLFVSEQESYKGLPYILYYCERCKNSKKELENHSIH